MTNTNTNTSTNILFDYEQYNKLLEAVAVAANNGEEDARDDLRDIPHGMDSFYNYVQAVDQHETRVRIAYIRAYDQREACEAVAALDRARRIAHEGAIAMARLLNRYARAYGTEKIFLGDPDDRMAVADFCLEVTNVLFKEGQKR